MIKPHLWLWIEFLSSGGQESQCIHVIQQQPFSKRLLIPCKSPWDTPILGVKKSNDKWRLVQDLQIINETVVLFTHMPKTNGFSCLQVWVDTFLDGLRLSLT